MVKIFVKYFTKRAIILVDLGKPFSCRLNYFTRLLQCLVFHAASIFISETLSCWFYYNYIQSSGQKDLPNPAVLSYPSAVIEVGSKNRKEIEMDQVEQWLFVLQGT